VSTRFALQPRQSIDRAPTAWENELADVIEAAFASGAYELDALVACLNDSRVRPRDGEAWTAERFTRVIHDLGTT
jgi:hypothetical protein